MLSVIYSINVDTCISITLYAVCRYAIYIYVFSFLYVHSMYVHYLYTCIYNSLSCIVVCLVLFGFTRYVCALICYCHWEKSSNLSFLGVDLMLLYQDLLQIPRQICIMINFLGRCLRLSQHVNHGLFIF